MCVCFSLALIGTTSEAGSGDRSWKALDRPMVSQLLTEQTNPSEQAARASGFYPFATWAQDGNGNYGSMLMMAGTDLRHRKTFLYASGMQQT